MVLGQVISKLSEGDIGHVPFRDSNLTRILKKSLGGNTKTAIICTVTPAEDSQTKSTLDFAARAKKIVQHVLCITCAISVAMSFQRCYPCCTNVH